MTIAKLTYAVVFFVSGLGVGVLWNPICSTSQMPPDGRVISDVQSRNEKYLAKTREVYGEEAAEFARQFEGMTIRIKEFPIDAWASPDGRFVIRLFGSDETIASDLRCPEKGEAMKELVRHYYFSCGDLAYSCDFARSIRDPKMTNVVFGVSVKGKPTFSYVDRDADGLWDSFIDYTQEPPQSYIRESLCWKRSTKDSRLPVIDGQGK